MKNEDESLTMPSLFSVNDGYGFFIGVAPGQELNAEDLTIGQVSPETAPEQSFDNITAVLNRTAKVELVKGQAVVEPLLAEKGSGSGLQALVPAGMRAITIEVNEFSGLGRRSQGRERNNESGTQCL